MTFNLYKMFQDYVKLEKERGNFLRSRHLQYLLAFSYWPGAEPRTGGNIYEIRSYRYSRQYITDL